MANTEPTVPVIFNDYLNTIMADPTTAKLEALIPAVKAVGAEVFCIDAGWFADDLGDDWWGSVGAWMPSTTRFTGGLGAMLQTIRSHGLIPGLWIEPLAVGLESPVVDELRHLCMTRAGVPIVEQGRLRLDLRDERARAHLDSVIDRIVGYGIGYLKIDDNFSAGSGPDAGADSPGDGLLEHQRAWAAWIERFTKRYPQVIVENCASGGMSTDYALLAHARVQSTSDLQDMQKYPTIAAAAPMLVLPEQAASWGVPQPEMSRGEVISTLVTSLAGTLYLSGNLDQLDDEATALVQAAASFASAEREWLPQRKPHWPLGLPGWTDAWVALALLPEQDSANDDGLLFLWHRAGGAETATVTLRTAHRNTCWTLEEQCFPAPALEDLPWEVFGKEGSVQFRLPSPITTARIYRIRQLSHRGGVNDAACREEA